MRQLSRPVGAKHGVGHQNIAINNVILSEHSVFTFWVI